MMQKIQKFGGAMFTPVMLFAVFGVIIGFSTLFTTESIMGPLAAEGTIWYGFWNMILTGGWTVFTQLPILFAIALPIGLAKKQKARACMEAFVIYIVFNNFLSAILSQWGPTFGVDFAQDVGGSSGLAMIANIKTLDMGMAGALLISGVSIYLHNKFFEKRLPEWAGVFKGSALVVGIGFFVMIPLAFLSAFIWPKVQDFISVFQKYLTGSGFFGIWLFVLLEKLLIPFGLHHLMYAPIYFDNVVINGGIIGAWANDMPNLADSTTPIAELAPYAMFTSTSWSKIFGCIGIALAFYKTALPENKKKVAGLMIPVTLTAIIAGVTEPIEFTFLFIAPLLFVVHGILAAFLSVLMNFFGVVGIFTGGLIEISAYNWIPLSANHRKEYLPMFLIGGVAIIVWYLVFKFLIEKLDIKTPGRSVESDNMKLFTKEDYKEKNKDKSDLYIKDDEFKILADKILIGLGGPDNISDYTNCVTRLRVNVKDESLVMDDNYFREIGTYGTSKNGKSIHVIVGTNIPYVADEFGSILGEEFE